MADNDNPTETTKAALVIDFTVLKTIGGNIHDFPKKYPLYGKFISTAAYTAEQLAAVREHMGPSWPLNDPQVAPAVVACLPPARDSVPAGPMAWPLLTPERIVAALTSMGVRNPRRYLERPESPTKPGEEQVRVLRVIEYTGPRAKVEQQVSRSLHGTRDHGNGVATTAVTLHEYPEVLEQAKPEAIDKARMERMERMERLEAGLVAIADLDATTRARNVYRPEGERRSSLDTAMDIARETLGLDTPPAAVPQSPAPTPDAVTTKSVAAAEVPDARTDRSDEDTAF